MQYVIAYFARIRESSQNKAKIFSSSYHPIRFLLQKVKTFVDAGHEITRRFYPHYKLKMFQETINESLSQLFIPPPLKAVTVRSVKKTMSCISSKLISSLPKPWLRFSLFSHYFSKWEILDIVLEKKMRRARMTGIHYKSKSTSWWASHCSSDACLRVSIVALHASFKGVSFLLSKSHAFLSRRYSVYSV